MLPVARRISEPRARASAKDFALPKFPNVPVTKCRMLSYPVKMIGLNNVNPSLPLLLPMNPYRVRLIVPNTTGATIFISFDPADMQGIPVMDGTAYAEISGTVTVDPVYVRGAAGVIVRGYEGVPLEERGP